MFYLTSERIDPQLILSRGCMFCNRVKKLKKIFDSSLECLWSRLQEESLLWQQYCNIWRKMLQSQCKSVFIDLSTSLQSLKKVMNDIEKFNLFFAERSKRRIWGIHNYDVKVFSSFIFINDFIIKLVFLKHTND